MSLASDHRQSHHATAILEELPEEGRKLGATRVIETLPHWKNAVGFYLQAGLTITHHQNSPWCREAHFRLDLRSE